jgi:hypothetical protein
LEEDRDMKEMNRGKERRSVKKERLYIERKEGRKGVRIVQPKWKPQL